MVMNSGRRIKKAPGRVLPGARLLTLVGRELPTRRTAPTENVAAASALPR